MFSFKIIKVLKDEKLSVFAQEILDYQIDLLSGLTISNFPERKILQQRINEKVTHHVMIIYYFLIVLGGRSRKCGPNWIEDKQTKNCYRFHFQKTTYDCKSSYNFL